MDTCRLILVLTLEVLKGLSGTDVGNSTTRQITFLDSGTGRVKSILHPVLLLLHLNLGTGTDIKDSDSTGKFTKPLLEFLLVIVGSGGLDLLADLGDPVSDVFLDTRPTDDGGIVFGDSDFLGFSKHVGSGVLKSESPLLGHDDRTGQCRDVLKHLLAAISETRGLDSGDLQGAAQLVDHESCQSLTIDILGDDQQGPSLTSDRLKNRKEILHRGDLLVADKNGAIIKDSLHLVRIGHEIRRNVTPVELHSLNHLDLRLGALGLFNSDDTVTLDLGHSVSDKLSDGSVIVGGNGSDLLNLGIVVTDFLALLLEVSDNSRDSFVDTPLEVHRVGTGGHILQTNVDDSLGKNRGGGSTITSLLISLGSDFLNHLGAHVGIPVLKLDFLGDSHTILGDLRSTELLVDNDITALRSKGYLHGVSQSVSSFLHLGADINIEFYLFCHNKFLLK